MQTETLNSAVIIIGNEILSGKTQDLNIQFIAKELGNIGIRLKEVRVVPDIENDIVEAVNSLRKKYKYVFTTGGIGPTHDDITAKTIAKAFNDEYVVNESAKAIMEAHLMTIGEEMTREHLRMAYMPKSAIPLLNRETAAPGFKIENVFVMAGVPSVMQTIFHEVKKYLQHGKPIISKAVDIEISENLIAQQFSALQDKYPSIEMGSYPFKGDHGWATSLVLRGDDEDLIDKAMEELLEIIMQIK